MGGSPLEWAPAGGLIWKPGKRRDHSSRELPGWDEFLQKALAEPIQILAGMVSNYDPEFEKNLPENKFLKKYGFCDDKYRLIDKEGHLVDAEGNKLDSNGNLVEPKEVKEDVGEFSDDEEELVVSPVPDDTI